MVSVNEVDSVVEGDGAALVSSAVLGARWPRCVASQRVRWRAAGYASQHLPQPVGRSGGGECSLDTFTTTFTG